MYYAVSASVLGVCGEHSPMDKLTTLVPRGPWLKVIGMLMLIHMIISYTISSTVLTRAIFVNTGYSIGVERSIVGRAAWFAASSIILVLTAVMANSIPDFNHLVALVTDIGICPLCFILPCALFLSMDAKRPAEHPEKAGLPLKAACYFTMGLFTAQMVLGGGVDIVAIINSKDSLACNSMWPE